MNVGQLNFALGWENTQRFIDMTLNVCHFFPQLTRTIFYKQQSNFHAWVHGSMWKPIIDPNSQLPQPVAATAKLSHTRGDRESVVEHDGLLGKG